jgi:hypothetical protein
MPARTIKGSQFTIIIEGKQITVKHVTGKGKRCRVIAPDGVRIEANYKNAGPRCPNAVGTDPQKTSQID